MPAHLIRRKSIWYIRDGLTRYSTKTDNEQLAKEILERYIRERLGLPEPTVLALNHSRLDPENRQRWERLRSVPTDQNAKDLYKQFGKPDSITNMRRLRFPCVYAFIRSGEVVYVGSSVNGFARVMASHHPMVQNAHDSDQIAFWVTGSEVEARELEIKMIKALRPKFNLGSNGELKTRGLGQRIQPYHELRKILRQVIREELQAMKSLH